MLKTLFYSSLAINLGLFLGRLSGLARESIVATTFGATSNADTVVLMLTVPDLMVNILMGGAMGAMLIPEFTNHPDHAQRLLYQAVLLFGSLFTLFTLLSYWQMGGLIDLLAPGFSESQKEGALTLLGRVIWLVPLTVVNAIFIAYLHAKNRFAIAAMGTLILNCSIIAGLLLVRNGFGMLDTVAFFVLIGGIFRLLSQILQINIVLSPIKSFSPWKINKTLLIRYFQAMLSGSVLVFFPVIAIAIASYQDEGSVAVFNYAHKLLHFPLTMTITFLIILLYPRLAQSFKADPEQHRQFVRRGVQIIICVSLVSAFLLSILSYEYASAIYNHGNMQSASVTTVAKLISIGMMSLPFQGLSSFLTAVFNSRKDTRTPLILNSIGLLFFLLVSFTGIAGEGLPSLMKGMVASYILICVLQLFFLKMDSFNWSEVILEKTFLIGLVGGLVLSVGLGYLISEGGLSDWSSLILACLAGLLSLVSIAWLNADFRSILKIALSKK